MLIFRQDCVLQLGCLQVKT